MNKIYQVLRVRTNWLHFTTVLLLTLIFLVGLWFMFFLLAWGHFGEGENSKFYSQWTGILIITAACLSMELVIFLLFRNRVKSNSQSEAKSYLISGIIVLAVFIVAIIFLRY